MQVNEVVSWKDTGETKQEKTDRQTRKQMGKRKRDLGC